jgi:hypothetical protein
MEQMSREASACHEKPSPSEINDKLIQLARQVTETRTTAMPNAGRRMQESHGGAV